MQQSKDAKQHSVTGMHIAGRGRKRENTASGAAAVKRWGTMAMGNRGTGRRETEEAGMGNQGMGNRETEDLTPGIHGTRHQETEELPPEKRGTRLWETKESGTGKPSNWATGS